MSYPNHFCTVHAMGRRRSTLLGVLALGFAGTAMTAACSPGGSGSSASGCPAPDFSLPETPTQCPAPEEVPCMRYHIPLDGSPSTDVALRNKYIAAFGSACYMSEANTFGCFYKKWQDACADAVRMAEVYGAAPYDKGYMCQPVAGTEDYTLQVGPDVANQITINYQAAPRQSPLVEVDGVPTEVSGPYRDLNEPKTLRPGEDFYCDSGMVGADGLGLKQKEWILLVNRKNSKSEDGGHDGRIRSDLAGFTWPCTNEKCEPVICEEPEFLPDPRDPVSTYPQVHHVVPRKDQRLCPWGTNSNKNAAVISAKLNKYFTNNNPPADEVKRLNSAPAHMP